MSKQEKTLKVKKRINMNEIFVSPDVAKCSTDICSVGEELIESENRNTKNQIYNNNNDSEDDESKKESIIFSILNVLESKIIPNIKDTQ